MKHTDKLTTLFDKIETSINSNKETTQLVYLKYYEEIVKTLVQEGIIRTYTTGKGLLTLYFNTRNNFHLKIKRISKPGKRVYFTSTRIAELRNKLEKLYLISTSKGIFSNHTSTGEGGELLCEITFSNK